MGIVTKTAPNLLFGCMAVLAILYLTHIHHHQATSSRRIAPKSIRARSTVILPTPYPKAFRVEFDTNISRNKEDQTCPIRSTLYYNWDLRAQRVDHPAGSYECIRFYNVTTRGCRLYFLKRGMYRIIDIDETISTGKVSSSDINLITKEKGDILPCCLDIPGLGAPPPDWNRQGRPFFNGHYYDYYSGMETYEFLFGLDDNNEEDEAAKMRANFSDLDFSKDKRYQAPAGDRHQQAHNLNSRIVTSPIIYDKYHTAREVHQHGSSWNGFPLTFTFPSKAQGLQDYHFDVSTMVVESQDPDIFRLPEGCEIVLCNQGLVGDADNTLAD